MGDGLWILNVERFPAPSRQGRRETPTKTSPWSSRLRLKTFFGSISPAREAAPLHASFSSSADLRQKFQSLENGPLKSSNHWNFSGRDFPRIGTFGAGPDADRPTKKPAGLLPPVFIDLFCKLTRETLPCGSTRHTRDSRRSDCCRSASANRQRPESTRRQCPTARHLPDQP